MKRWVILLVMVVGVAARAAPSSELVSALTQVFPPADHHSGLVHSQEPFEPAKIHGYVTIKKEGIPAAQAFWYITRQEYEFRPLMITDGAAKTHFGKVDVSLEPGTVMAVVETSIQGHSVNIKLLSKDVIVPKDAKPKSSSTRVGTSLVFKFPKLQMTAADAPAILSRIEEYITPMTSLPQASPIAARPAKVGAPVTKTVPPPTVAEVPAKGVVQTGMGMDEVRRIKGEPRRILNRGNMITYDYGDHEVIFVQGKVSDIRWK